MSTWTAVQSTHSAHSTCPLDRIHIHISTHIVSCRVRSLTSIVVTSVSVGSTRPAYIDTFLVEVRVVGTVDDVGRLDGTVVPPFILDVESSRGTDSSVVLVDGRTSSSRGITVVAAVGHDDIVTDKFGDLGAGPTPSHDCVRVGLYPGRTGGRRAGAEGAGRGGSVVFKAFAACPSVLKQYTVGNKDGSIAD